MFGVEQDLHGLTYRRDIPEPGVDARPGGRLGQDGLEFFLPGAGGAASWFPACPAGTGRILVACQSAGHSCTVLSVRSTIPAMMPASTPREACRTASAFIPASTRLPERLLHPTRTAVSSGATPTRTPPPHPKQHRKPTKNTVPFHDGHRAGVIKSFE